MEFFNSTIRLLYDWQGRGFINATSMKLARYSMVYKARDGHYPTLHGQPTAFPGHPASTQKVHP